MASSPSEGIGWRENGSVVSESAAQEATELEKLGRWRDGVHRGHTLLALSSYLKQEGKQRQEESFVGCGHPVPVSLGLPHF